MGLGIRDPGRGLRLICSVDEVGERKEASVEFCWERAWLRSVMCWLEWAIGRKRGNMFGSGTQTKVHGDPYLGVR